MEAKTGYILNWTMLPCDDCTLIAGYFLKSGWGGSWFMCTKNLTEELYNLARGMYLKTFIFFQSFTEL